MNAKIATGVLILCLTVLGGVFELYARLGFPRMSKVQALVEAQWLDARLLQPRRPDGTAAVLFVGNSLLEAGITQASLRRLNDGRYGMKLLPISNTQALDWEFGIRRLVREGSRPSVVVLVLGIQHLRGTRLNGSYFSHYMLAGDDWFDAVARSQSGATQGSEMLFANKSAWLGARSTIRNAIAEKVFPGMKSLAVAFLPPRENGQADGAEAPRKSVEQISRIKNEVEATGAEFRLIVMPAIETSSTADAVVGALSAEGVRTLHSASCASFSRSDFSDGFHLNAGGAERFQEILEVAVKDGFFGQSSAGNMRLPAGCVRP